METFSSAGRTGADSTSRQSTIATASKNRKSLEKGDRQDPYRGANFFQDAESVRQRGGSEDDIPRPRLARVGSGRQRIFGLYLVAWTDRSGTFASGSQSRGGTM